MCASTSSPSIEDKPMLSDVMEHFGLTKSLRQVDYFETEHHRPLLRELKAAIHEGGIVALTGVVGSGKTMLLWRIQEQLRHEGQIEVSESLVFDVPRVTLSTLKLALYYDLATEKDGDLTGNRKRVSARCSKSCSAAKNPSRCLSMTAMTCMVRRCGASSSSLKRRATGARG